MKTGWKLAVLLGCLALAVACCTKPPQAVVSANQAFDTLKGTCAQTYAPNQYRAAEDGVNMLNDLVAKHKCCMAKKEAPGVVQKIDAATQANNTEQARAKQDAEAALAAARQAVQAAGSAVTSANDQGRQADSRVTAVANNPDGQCNKKEIATIATPIHTSEFAPASYQQAKDALAEAERLMAASPCNYYKVKEAAEKATQLANKAKADADSEIARVKAEESKKTSALEELFKNKPCYYTVVKNDCLWKIAEKPLIYGNPFLWPLIWDANRSLIKDHPDLIYPKWVFNITREFTPEDAKKAEKTARNHPWPPDYGPWAAPKAPAVTPAPTETPAPAPAPAPAPEPAPAPPAN
jgi:nucleoid-associated protein YgaU